MKKEITILDLGLIPYQQAYSIQKQLVDKVIAGESQTLIFCEHGAVLTLGRLAKPENVLWPEDELKKRGVELYSIDRGGDVTLHSPGQIILYPILNLNLFGRDLHLYLHKLEEVAIDFLKGFDIVATRFSGKTGVWVGDKKIASIGVGVKRWVSFHGLAININTDLNLFSLIRPCGMDIDMTSLAVLKQNKQNIPEIKKHLTDSFLKEFNLCTK